MQQGVGVRVALEGDEGGAEGKAEGEGEGHG